jgi:hypothetical protein
MTKYIFRFRAAAPFIHPVNVISLKIPHYYKIITSPMDLTTIKKRLDSLWYNNSEECMADIKLIFDNCYAFNTPGDFVSLAGKKVQDYINEKLEPLKNMPEEELPLPQRIIKPESKFVLT